MTIADVHHATNCEHGELTSGVEEGGAAARPRINTFVPNECHHGVPESNLVCVSLDLIGGEFHLQEEFTRQQIKITGPVLKWLLN